MRVRACPLPHRALPHPPAGPERRGRAGVGGRHHAPRHGGRAAGQPEARGPGGARQPCAVRARLLRAHCRHVPVVEPAAHRWAQWGLRRLCLRPYWCDRGSGEAGAEAALPPPPSTLNSQGATSPTSCSLSWACLHPAPRPPSATGWAATCSRAQVGVRACVARAAHTAGACVGCRPWPLPVVCLLTHARPAPPVQSRARRRRRKQRRRRRRPRACRGPQRCRPIFSTCPGCTT